MDLHGDYKFNVLCKIHCVGYAFIIDYYLIITEFNWNKIEKHWNWRRTDCLLDKTVIIGGRMLTQK